MSRRIYPQSGSSTGLHPQGESKEGQINMPPSNSPSHMAAKAPAITLTPGVPLLLGLALALAIVLSLAFALQAS